MRSELRRGVRRVAVLLVFILAVCTRSLEAQSFSSGSDGSDGVYAPSGPPGTVVMFNPAQFVGSQVSANIFNFTTITIPAGLTVRLSGSIINTPVAWLAQGDVNIQGTIDLSGANGHDPTLNPFARSPSIPGAGGYSGAPGGNTKQSALAGDGPNGGSAGICTADPHGHGGAFSGNQFLIPLAGGSGGGGDMQCNPANDTFGSGAGAGGGALLIASSTRVTIAGSSGKINGNGGDGGDGVSNKGAAGAGGAIRLISNTISADFGILSVNGGCGFNATEESTHNGGGGRIRVEAYSISLIGTVLGSGGCGPAAFSESAPFPLLLPTAGPPTARVVSIAGILVNPNPSTFPDITINTTIAVPVVIQTHNIPTTATVNLTILDQNGVPDTVIPAPPLGNCDQNNFCTTTVNVVFPFGASRGLTKVTWTQ